jgi:hypothetical protein
MPGSEPGSYAPIEGDETEDIVKLEVSTFETATFGTVVVVLPPVVAETLADCGLALPAASYAIT